MELTAEECELGGVVITLNLEDAHGRERFNDGETASGGFGVKYWPSADASYGAGASGRGMLCERASGWGIGRPCREALSGLSEHAHASAALELALQLIANRWKPSIVLQLAGGPQRRRDLEQRLPRYLSAKVLTEQLRALEADGLVHRVDRTPAGHGRHVTYALTELGQTLGPAVASLAEWAVEHRADLLRGRRSPFRERDDER